MYLLIKNCMLADKTDINTKKNNDLNNKYSGILELNLIFKIKAINMPIEMLKMILKTELNSKYNRSFLIKSSAIKENRPITMYIKICRYL